MAQYRTIGAHGPTLYVSIPKDWKFKKGGNVRLTLIEESQSFKVEVME